MFRLNDLILLLVIFSSMLAGILFPEPASVFQPYPLMTGLVVLFRSPVKNQLASVISIGNVNNVLVLVFSAEFFGPLSRPLRPCI